MKSVIVVPTIREESIARFLSQWDSEFASSEIIVVEDNPERSFPIDRANVTHYSWREIDQEMGSDSDLIPRRTDCVRSFGFLKAAERTPDVVITIDDDCYPDTPRFVERHFENLTTAVSSPAWVSSVSGAKPRGVPFHRTERSMPVAISHGLWTNVPDLDAPTQLSMAAAPQPAEISLEDQVIPRGSFFPMCGMNLAFRPEMIPALYFLRMGRGEPYDRFGDIWAGLFAKKICDHLGFLVLSGEPHVRHDRASNVWTNLRKEAPGLEVNETLWEAVDRIVLTGRTVTDCYGELAEGLAVPGEYWDRLRDSMVRWAKRF